MGSFSLKNPAAIDKIVASFTAENDKIDKLLLTKMNSIVTVVYNTARAKRPKISKVQQKAMGRGVKSYRVSDPNAAFGVPVDTGDLQISIKKDVKSSGEKVIGRVYVDGPGADHAAYMEFGTSKIRPRSFLRSAMHVNQDWIKREFAKPAKGPK